MILIDEILQIPTPLTAVLSQSTPMLEKAEQPIEPQAEIKEVETVKEPAISSRSLKKTLFSMVPNRFLSHLKKTLV